MSPKRLGPISLNPASTKIRENRETLGLSIFGDISTLSQNNESIFGESAGEGRIGHISPDPSLLCEISIHAELVQILTLNFVRPESVFIVPKCYHKTNVKTVFL